MKPTKEQIKEFWEWCGFVVKPNVVSLGTIDWPDYVWHDPEGSPRPDRGLPSINLNNLFRWAVPRVTSMHGVGRRLQVKIVSSWGESDGEYGVEISNMGKRLSIFFDKNPALALFWAIWKVMEETK